MLESVFRRWGPPRDSVGITRPRCGGPTLRRVETHHQAPVRARGGCYLAAFRGDFGTSAPIDLLLRDADTQWPGAFGARSVHDLAAVAQDEVFGRVGAGTWLPWPPRSDGVGCTHGDVLLEEHVNDVP